MADELKRLRERAGLNEQGEGFGSGDFASASAGIRQHSNQSWKADLMNQLAAKGPLGQAMVEAGKVAQNMNGEEMWQRIARAFLQQR